MRPAIVYVGLTVYHNDHPEWGAGTVTGLETGKAVTGLPIKVIHVEYANGVKDSCTAQKLRKMPVGAKKDATRFMAKAFVKGD